MGVTIKNNKLAGARTTVKEAVYDVVCTFTPNAQTVWNGESITIVLEDNDSMFHKKTVTVETVDGSTETITKSIPFSYASMSVSVSGFCTRYLGEQKTLGNLINNVPHSTLEQYFTGETFVSNGKESGYFVMTITADTGFEFVRDSLKNDLGAKFDYYNDGLTVAKQLLSNRLDNLDVGWAFTGETVAKGTKVVNNITGNVTVTPTIDGTNVSVVVTGTSEVARFVNVSVSYVDVNGETKNVIPDYSGNVINISLTDVKVGSDVVLSGEYRFVCTTSNEMTGCTVAGLKEFYIENETVKVVATAKAKTHFNPENVPFARWVTTIHGTSEHQFVLSEDGKTAKLTFTFPDNKEKISDSTFTLLGGTIPDKEIVGYGSINVYLVNTETLNEFSKIRFTKKLNESYEYEYYDIAQYVNTLHKVYVDVPNVSKSSLKVANFDTGIETNSVDDSKVHVDFGNVLLPSYSNNSNDFNVNIQCFVPFVGFVPIDGDFMGKTINLSYDIDLVTGYCAYCLKCDDIVINNGVTNCSSEIIYKTLANDEVGTVGDNSYLNSVLMGFEPYITVKYYDSLKDSIESTKKQVTINTVAGYSKFENVNLNTANLLVDEYNDIISQLENGVYL